MLERVEKAWRLVQRFFWLHVASEWQRANRSLRGTDQTYARYVKEAEKKGDRNEVESVRGEWSAVREPEQDEVNRLTTRYWEKCAARHRIPVPAYGHEPHWEQGWRGYRLTVEGIDFIESRIYEKRKRRWEFWLQFAPIVTAFAGLVGVLTGFLAVWHHSN